jgi:hypothetical protein
VPRRVTDVLVTALGLGLVAVPAVIVPSLLRIRGRAPWLVAGLVCAAADVVGCTTMLSGPRWLTRPGMLVALAVVAAASVALWHLAGRPRRSRLRRPERPLELGPAWWIVAVAVAAMLIQLYVDFRVAPSNWDSMTYHLSRAAYWLQQHSALHYGAGTVRQLGSGPNAEMMIAWSMLITGTDRWVELVQWISLAGLGLTIFSGARLLGFGTRAAAFAGALFLILPQPIMQAASTQNDLVASFFVAACALFVVRGLRDRHIGDLSVAGAALGLAIGTKGTALLALPSLGLLAAAALVAWRPPIRLVARALGLGLAGIAAFGAFNYVLNYRHTHDIFGGVKDQVSSTGGDRWQNAAHDIWTFADTPGVNLTWLQPLVQHPVQGIFGGTFGAGFPYAIDVNVNEDTSAYGLVGFLLLVPLLLVMLFGPRAPPGRRAVALAALVYLVLFSYRIDYNDWLGRVYMPGVVIAAPLFAAFARRAWSAGLVAALAVITLVPSVLQNPLKQILVAPGAQNVFALDRLHQMSQPRPEMWAITTQVFRFAPHGRFGYVGGEDSWDYPFFGAHHQHYVERMNATDVSYARMRRDRLDGVVFANVGLPPAPLRSVTMGTDYYWVGAR